MAYCLEPHESASRGVVRVVREQLNAAHEFLGRCEQAPSECVHEFRKSLKKVRGAVRLVRPALGEEAYKKLNLWARDAARQFAHLRDEDAMLEALARLDARYGTGPRTVGESIRVAVGVFHDLRERKRSEGTQLGHLIPDASKGIDAALELVGRWRLADQGFVTLSGGLAKTYRRGRRGFRAVYQDPVPERFHEWRKRVKYHWYHTRLLEGIWPAIMRTRRTTLDHLGELLGEHHDLAVLRQHLQSDWETFDRSGPMQPLIETSDVRQAEIYDEAWLIGRRVFAESPERLTQRLGDYWHAAQLRGVRGQRMPRTGARSNLHRPIRRRGPAGAAS